MVTVAVDKPLPLLDILTRMPEVEKAEIGDGGQLDRLDRDDILRGLALEPRPGTTRGQNITVTLRKTAEVSV